MANKRQRKKIEKQRQSAALSNLGYTRKQQQKLTPKERQVAAIPELKRQEKNRKQRLEYNKKKRFINQNRLENVSLYSGWTKKKLFSFDRVTPNLSWDNLNKLLRKKEKDKVEQSRIQSLLKAGYDLTDITQKMVRSDAEMKRWIDLKAVSHDIDWNKVYHTKDGIYIAFRDISENCNIGAIIRDYLNLPIDELLKELTKIVNMPKTHVKGMTGDSSGKAGQARFDIGEDRLVLARWANQDKQLLAYHNMRQSYLLSTRKYKKSKKRKWVPYQQLKPSKGELFHDFTLKNMVAIITAMLNNVFEEDREMLYRDFYYSMEEVEPKVTKYIPKP